MDEANVKPETLTRAEFEKRERIKLWHMVNGLVTGMLISDPRWKPAVEWLNKNRP